MKKIKDEFNINSNSIFNSFDKLNIHESPIESSFEYHQNIPSNGLIQNYIQSLNPINTRNQKGDINNSLSKEINNLSSTQVEFPATKEEYLNSLFNETKMMQNEINEKKSKLLKENAEIQEKKKKIN